jgi:hypothetical protein
MLFLVLAIALALHTLFWGAGLALLVVPRTWKRYWPVFVPVCGLTLQSTIVWLGIYSNRPGTDSFAAASEIVPLVLLAWGWWRRRSFVVKDLRRWKGLGGLMSVALIVIVWPFARASDELTTSSMGSCDAADYAAGARVLREFSRDDRSGFMGLKEVVQLESVDNFFDHWIKLNHFAPSALIAHHAAIFHRRSYELINVFTAGLLVLSLPIVFWLARSGLHYRARAAFFIALLYGLSPLMLYAVYHVAIGQLLAGQAIALLTWSGCVAARRPLTSSTGFGLAGLLLVGYALVLASYHFIVIVCLVPAVAYAGIRALWRREFRWLFMWSLVMGAPLVLASAIYWERVLGLRERFLLFRRIDFGWPIPALTPEGWLGIVASQSLGAHSIWLRVLLCTGFAAMCGWVLRQDSRGQRPWRLLTFCLTVPILIGYVYLEWRGAAKGTNASYDAYKLLAVFYPGLLASFAMWLRPLNGYGPPGAKLTIYAAATIVLAGNLFADASMWERMSAPHLIVNQSLRQLRTLERQSGIESVNVLTGDVWSRLWANAMLLRKAQYFSSDTFEGRRATALKGRYDLVGRVCRLETPGAKTIGDPASPSFFLIDTHAPDFLRVQNGAGWNDLECNYTTGRKLRWTQGDATVFIDNPSLRSIRVSARLRASAIDDRDLEIQLGDRVLLRSRAGPPEQSWDLGEFEILPGRNTLMIHSSRPGLVSPGKDHRRRGFSIRELRIRPIMQSTPSVTVASTTDPQGCRVVNGAVR